MENSAMYKGTGYKKNCKATDLLVLPIVMEWSGRLGTLI